MGKQKIEETVSNEKMIEIRVDELQIEGCNKRLYL